MPARGGLPCSVSIVPPRIPEQQVIAEAMTAGGAAWAQSIREAVRTTMDRLAWDDMREVRPRLAAEEAGRLAEHARASQAEAAASALHQELARTQEAAEVRRLASDRQLAKVEADRDEALSQLANLGGACATLLADVARSDAAGARDRAIAASLSRSLQETRRALDESNQQLARPSLTWGGPGQHVMAGHPSTASAQGRVAQADEARRVKCWPP